MHEHRANDPEDRDNANKFMHNKLVRSNLLKVSWRRGVILWHCSQNSQAEWVRITVGPHHLSVMTRGRGLDQVCSFSIIPALGAEKRNFTFTFTFIYPTDFRLLVLLPYIMQGSQAINDYAKDGGKELFTKMYCVL